MGTGLVVASWSFQQDVIRAEVQPSLLSSSCALGRSHCFRLEHRVGNRKAAWPGQLTIQLEGHLGDQLVQPLMVRMGKWRPLVEGETEDGLRVRECATLYLNQPIHSSPRWGSFLLFYRWEEPGSEALSLVDACGWQVEEPCSNPMTVMHLHLLMGAHLSFSVSPLPPEPCISEFGNRKGEFQGVSLAK